MINETQVRMMDSVSRLGYRVTVGDVAAEVGLSVDRVRRELNFLASQTGGSLQVAPSGEIAYQFTPQWRSIWDQKLQNAKWQAFMAQAKKTALYLGRISFGVMLVLSLVLIAVALFALSTAMNKDDDDGPNVNFGGFYWLWYGFDPYIFFYYGADQEQERRRRYEAGEPVGFLEGVFSFLFGDGDPNQNLENERWQLVGRTIRAKGGVVTAEELAPYLDAPYDEQENYLLPVLVKFDGQPQVSDEGGLVYQFPQLQVTAQDQTSVAPQPPYLAEKPWEFSKAPQGTLAMAAGLGVLNFIGAGFLATVIADLSLEATSLAWIPWISPILLIYGTLFLLVPAVRYALLGGRNAKVQARNQTRAQRTKILSQASSGLRAKLAFARQFMQQQILDRNQTIYDSGQSVLDQKDLEGEDFDRKLNA